MADAITPPKARTDGMTAGSEGFAAVSSLAKVSVLKARSDFLRTARGHHARTPGFALQARRREGVEAAGLRVGFTCSRKVGNAVARNRAKRRLREAARQVLPAKGKAGWDYVLVGLRDRTAARPFAELVADLARALDKVHAQ